MVLAGLIKSPDSGIYSPMCQDAPKTPPPCAAATGRFEYTKSQMKKVTGPGFLPPADVDQLVYPAGKEAAKAWSGNAAEQAIKGPNGFVVHQVMSELSALRHPDGTPWFPPTGSNSLLNGGYQIITTIDKTAQDAAIKYAGHTSADRQAAKTFPTGIGAAVVAVQPGTGSVLAYYGGKNGTGIDWAGVWDDPVTSTPGLSGGHIFPGSNFKTVTMATALSKGLSIDSLWYGPDERLFTQRGAAGVLRNASKGDDCGTPDNYCSMQEGLRKSLNTMYYAIGTDSRDGMNPGAIVDMAYYLGIRHMWGGDKCGGKRVDLTGKNGGEYTDDGCIGAEVSFGQFGVPLQDLANVMATYASRGVKADEHFVKSVSHGIGDAHHVDYTAQTRLSKVPNYNEWNNADLTYAMTTVWGNANEKKNQLEGDRPVAAKTGTWELGVGNLSKVNGTVLLSGFTGGDGKPNTGQIAMSVWVGNNGTATKKVNGKDVPYLVKVPYASDGPPADIFHLIANAYEKNGPDGKPWPIQQFTQHTSTGDPSKGDPTPPPSPSSTPTPTNPTTTGGPSCDPTACPGSTPPPADTQKPTPPGSVGVADAKPNQVTLTWQPATDDVGVVGYRIYRNGNYVGSSADPTYVDTKVQGGKQYDYQVTAIDAAGNESDRSNTATAHT
jgi:membrane peptidoglycan carboxypeptidase